VPGIRQFIEKCEAVKDKYNKLVKYRTVINCYEVSDDLIDLIKEYNIETGVSLDGPKKMTDISRIDTKGEGAYDKIEAGIKKLREAGIYIDGAVCTLGQHNVHYPKEIIKFFDEIGISFKPRPVNILGRGVGSELQTLPGEWARCFSEMHAMSKGLDIENFSVHIFEENVYTPIRDYICMRYPCGAAREIISVNPNGEVFPCDGFKGQDEFIMGNVLEEKIIDMIKKPKFAQMRNRTYKDIPQCSKCMFRGMCCSCCYSAYGKFGSIYREDPHCADRKQIYLYLMQYWLKNHVLDK
jgi:radical SAM protein with 4Fe4S-binding SPASM domain